jgi:hypothetical protein
MDYYTEYMQGNGVSVRVGSTNKPEVVFDLVGIVGSRRMGSDFTAFQNLTVKEAKKLRKVLKKAIDAVEGNSNA